MKSLENSALRLIMFNQYKIMSLLNKNNEDSYCYYQDIIVEGIEKKYPILLETIGFGGSGVPVKVSEEVDLILEIFCKVQNSIIELEMDVQRELKADYHIYFEGFNASNETERPYYTYNKFVRKYNEAKLPASGNGSSGLTLYHYNKMMKNYMKYGEQEILDEEKIREICLRKDELAPYEAFLVNFKELGSSQPMQFIKEDKTYHSD